MNIQAMMKQAQKIQKEMQNAKEEIDNKVFTGTNSFVTVNLKGTKEIESIKIDAESLDIDEIEILQDIIMVAINNAMKEIDNELETKMGKYTQGMPGLF